MANSPSHPSLSSPAPAPSDATAHRSSPSSASSASTARTALAFLVHSPTTVEQNLPPDVDNKPLARQKRRRTSKEDEDILKAEYLRNPKPDKAQRMEIVAKVALGEKEVQVWFQNKRQNDRRRKYRLDPNAKPSDAALMSSSSMSSDPASPDEDELNPSPSEDRRSLPPQADIDEIERADQSDATQADVQPQPKVADPELVKMGSQTTDSLTVTSTDPCTVETAPTDPGSSQQSISATLTHESTQPRTSYLANRRSASFVRSLEESSLPTPTKPETEPLPPSSTLALKRTHSFVRLSMTADGKARVVTDADQSPSPPHKRPSPSDFNSPSLRRSYSAAGLNERLSAAAHGEPSPKIQRTSVYGRSRDSRAWEFWCDPDSRNSLSLTAKAEQEGSGSAADAIGLIRANSRRSVLGKNQNKRNAAVPSRRDSITSSAKKSRAFRRAETTNGRLQSKETTTKSKVNNFDDSSSDDFIMPQTESDKENWEPKGASTPHASRRTRPYPTPNTTSRAPRQILGENTEIMSQTNSLGAMLERERAPKKDKSRVTDPEGDDELRLFMSGADGMSSRTTLSSGEELGCVEGLLKLSRGDWR